MPIYRIPDKTPLANFPFEFSKFVKSWATFFFYQGVSSDNLPEIEDFKLYAEHVSVDSDLIYNLMRVPTTDVPPEVLKNLGLAISSKRMRVEVIQEVTCFVKSDYRDKE